MRILLNFFIRLMTKCCFFSIKVHGNYFIFPISFLFGTVQINELTITCNLHDNMIDVFGH